MWLTIAAAVVFAPVLHASVRVKSLESSTQKPKIIVAYDGKPVANARLYIYHYRNDSPEGPLEKLHRKFIADDHGQVVLPNLPWGIYEVAASSGPTLKGDILLSMAPPPFDPSYTAFQLNLVGKWGNGTSLEEASAFTLELDYHPTEEQILAQEDQLPVTKVAVFWGRVSDPTDADIPHASIEITRMDVPGKRRTVQLKADEQGKFAASFPDGDYVATFKIPGFQIQILHLVISKDASNQPLQIKLQVGLATE
jgi:hypothetical protein